MKRGWIMDSICWNHSIIKESTREGFLRKTNLYSNYYVHETLEHSPDIISPCDGYSLVHVVVGVPSTGSPLEFRRMISLANFNCLPITSAVTVPVPNAPRAVLPTRLTYSDGSRGKSNNTTCLIFLPSNPREALSVQINNCGVESSSSTVNSPRCFSLELLRPRNLRRFSSLFSRLNAAW